MKFKAVGIRLQTIILSKKKNKEMTNKIYREWNTKKKNVRDGASS